VVVVRAEDAEQALAAARALADGGIALIEITMTVPDAINVIVELRRQLPANVMLGAGTVLDGRSASLAVKAGADFIVSPILDPGMVRVCKVHDRVAVPGAFSPTEIVAALKAGADIVKLFPASLGGPGLVKDLRGPFPDIKLLPTGGVTLENAGEFIRAGAFAVAAGSNIVDKKALSAGNYELITQAAQKFATAVREARGAKPA
jgi:2-dehydro-3-deoxyphosphogluconate aldolase/(4S)-4-hydroxy-2-oxoglutarate aldolase